MSMKRSHPAFIKSGLTALALAVAGVHSAQARQGPANSGDSPVQGTVKVDIARSGQIDLEVREATLGAALDALAGKAGIPIRYSNAPEQRLNLACHGDSLKPVLLCLLGTDADLFLEYATGGKPAQAATEIAGVTVLASTFSEKSPASPMGQAQDSDGTSTRPRSGVDFSTPTVETALRKIRSEDAEERASGLEWLGRIEGVDEPALRAAYEAGLQDRDGEVRATALAGLSTLDRENSTGRLFEAMGDEDPSVRLTAVDRMELNEQSRPYLEQALTDADESVRELAGLRLGLAR
jgi:hypothetical protein